MQYSEAFEKLGYTLGSVRTDWSAANATGVCLAIWQKSLTIENGLPCLDVFELTKDELPNENGWMNKSAHKKRSEHLKQAIEKFDSKVDVILVFGTPEVSYGDAEPWIPQRRGGFWKVTKFDPSNGLFRVEVTKISAS